MVQELERVSQLTKEEAKKLLTEEILDETRHDVAVQVRNLEQQAKEEADLNAKNIVTLAIQRCAADHASEVTVSVVPLPNDDMKARIIGREGRNIRAIENATGIELIIDDTPEVVILSGFDPVRREIARLTLERLIADGRIHPARIEETVEKVTKELDQQIKAAGENAMFEVGIFGLHPELIKLIGRLKFRTSYGQNVYKHSIEVANLAGLMAQELGLDVNFAKRAGLLHDIGKAVDHEQEGTHIQIGADLAKKYKENAMIVNAIMAHHGDVEPKTIEAVLVQATTATSNPRPSKRCSCRRRTPSRARAPAREGRRAPITSNVSKNSRRSPRASRVWTRVTPSRRAERCASSSSPIRWTTRRRSSLPRTSPRRSKRNWNIPVRSRSTSSANSAAWNTQSKIG